MQGCQPRDFLDIKVTENKETVGFLFEKSILGIHRRVPKIQSDGRK